VFKQGDEFTSMAQLEYELIQKLQDQWIRASNIEIATFPIIQVHHIRNNEWGSAGCRNGGNLNNFLVAMN